jgi:ABC-type glycerol-3-phosphate transport system permease component
VLVFISLIVATSQFRILTQHQSLASRTEVNWPHIAAVVIVVVLVVGLGLFLLQRRRKRAQL